MWFTIDTRSGARNPVERQHVVALRRARNEGMRILRSTEYRRMPWRNGGGTTTEIAIAPLPSASGDRFAHRVSIADVATDGPFSRFDGYERLIMLVEGAGMILDCGAH